MWLGPFDVDSTRPGGNTIRWHVDVENGWCLMLEKTHAFFGSGRAIIYPKHLLYIVLWFLPVTSWDETSVFFGFEPFILRFGVDIPDSQNRYESFQFSEARLSHGEQWRRSKVWKLEGNCWEEFLVLHNFYPPWRKSQFFETVSILYPPQKVQRLRPWKMMVGRRSLPIGAR